MTKTKAKLGENQIAKMNMKRPEKMSKVNAKQKWYMSLPSQLKTRLSSVFVTIWRVRRRIFFIGEVIAIVVGIGSGGVFELT